MRDITFFHCADIHLDSPFSSLSGKPGLSAARRRGLLEAFSRLISNARNEKPDFLLIAGDLFENAYVHINTISTLNALFGSIPETMVVMITGNHDIEAANSYYRTYDWNENVFFLGQNKRKLHFETLGTTVHGLGWEAGQSFTITPNTMKPDEGVINILLFHGDIDLQIGTRNYNSISSEQAASMGFDYIAAGHNHRKRIYHDLIYNPGSLDPLGFDEPGVHGYFKGSVSKTKGISIEFIENSMIEYVTMEADISEFDNDAMIIENLIGKLQKDNVLYKILLVGKKSMDYAPDTIFIENALMEHALFCKVRDESSVTIPVDELALLRGLKGEFARTVMERMESAKDDEKEILMKALYYGIKAIDDGNIEKAGGIEF
ncbi:MAG TPA: DNA repair exonuclease [Clostridia bacterium]|nr:DNA repair exonuclease [Clostridia bacterium]